MILQRIKNTKCFLSSIIMPSLSLQCNQLPSTQALYRHVHSTNRSEVDYLVTRYRLTNGNNKAFKNHSIYGMNGRMAFFNSVEDIKLTREVTIDCLKDLLSLNKSQSQQLIRQYPILNERTDTELKKQLTHLSKRGINQDLILKCPWMLFLPLSLVDERFSILKEHGFNGKIREDHLVLLLLRPVSFNRISKRFVKNELKEKKEMDLFSSFTQRINLFTTKLHINNEEFCDLFRDHIFLFTYDFDRIKTIIDLLLDAGIEPEAIINDFKIFTHNIDTMRNRIEVCQKHKIPIKIWMLRSPIEAFQVALKRHDDNKKALKDHTDSIEYLASQLKCDKDIILTLKKRYPKLVQISAKKLSEIISFLFGKGFTPYHIIDTPKILFHSVKTVEKRTSELDQLNLCPTALKVLTLSNEEYNKVIKTLSSSE